MFVALKKTAAKAAISRPSGSLTWNMEDVQGIIKIHFQKLKSFLIYFEGFGTVETLVIEIISRTVNPVMRFAWILLAATHVCYLKFLDLVKVIIQGGDTMQNPKVVLNSFMEAVLAITTNTKPKKNVKLFVLKKQNCHFT